ncbi:hypothetical protein C5167_026111 [Papaver somniferum]|nr:hypothetical protein C5167_026111 [Papaver somniferum]
MKVVVLPVVKEEFLVVVVFNMIVVISGGKVRMMKLIVSRDNDGSGCGCGDSDGGDWVWLWLLGDGGSGDTSGNYHCLRQNHFRKYYDKVLRVGGRDLDDTVVGYKFCDYRSTYGTTV